jgi:hypothetical protein
MLRERRAWMFKEVDAHGGAVWKALRRVPSTLPQNNGRLITVWAPR